MWNPFGKDSLGLTPGDWFKLWLRRDDMFSKLSSRKLWATVAAAAIAAFGGGLGIPEAAIHQIVQLVTVYIIGQAVVDTGTVVSKPKGASPAPATTQNVEVHLP